MPMYFSPHQLACSEHKLTLKAATGSMDRMAEKLAAQKQQRELETLNEIALTQMRSLLDAGAIKHLGHSGRINKLGKKP